MMSLIFALMFGGGPPVSQYDKVIISQLWPRPHNSRADMAPDGEMIGIIQEEMRLGLGLMLEEVHPFKIADRYGRPTKPFRRIIGVSSLKTNQ
jgi:hypothetical protein